jgi:hypothetical protein
MITFIGFLPILPYTCEVALRFVVLTSTYTDFISKGHREGEGDTSLEIVTIVPFSNRALKRPIHGIKKPNIDGDSKNLVIFQSNIWLLLCVTTLCWGQQN